MDKARYLKEHCTEANAALIKAIKHLGLARQVCITAMRDGRRDLFVQIQETVQRAQRELFAFEEPDYDYVHEDSLCLSCGKGPISQRCRDCYIKEGEQADDWWEAGQ